MNNLIDKYAQKKNILILYDGPFPYGNAMASRIRSFCKIFSELNMNVHVICMKSSIQSESQTEHINECYSFTTAPKVTQSLREKFFGNPSYRDLTVDYIKNNKPNIVFTTSCRTYFKKVAKVCESLNIPIYVEQCEWMDVTEFIFRYFDIRFIRMTRLIKNGYKKANGIVAISSRFEEHYKKQNVKVIRIPTILDVKYSPYRTEIIRDKLIFVFTGSVARGKKELIAPIINVFIKNEVIRENAEFHIYGENKTAIERNIGRKLPDELNTCVFIHGRIPQVNIQDILINADFQIFLRPQRRSSNFGFPTKLGESMAVGTPIITNDTSDIGLYVKNGENGFLLSAPREDELEHVLCKVISMSKVARCEMRKKARQTAEIWFDYRNYISKIEILFGAK